MPREITRARVVELLDYDPGTGEFRWKRSKGRASAGSLAGWRRGSSGYLQIGINRQLYQAHRLAWLVMHGAMPTYPMEIDHINRDKSDNRIANLRVVSRAENTHNSGLQRNNTSGYTGVNWHRRHQKYVARIQANGKPKFLGYFATADAAHAAYLAAKAILHPTAPRDLIDWFGFDGWLFPEAG
jgi:hypothetical protein